MMSQVPFSPHMMGHMDEQGRKKLQGSKISGFFTTYKHALHQRQVYCVKFFVLFFSHICLILLQRRPRKWRRCHCNTLMTWSDVWRRCWGCGGFWWITNSTSLSPHCPRYNICKIQYYPPPLSFKKKMKIITILLNVTFFCVGPTESAERNEF